MNLCALVHPHVDLAASDSRAGVPTGQLAGPHLEFDLPEDDDADQYRNDRDTSKT